MRNQRKRHGGMILFSKSFPFSACISPSINRHFLIEMFLIFSQDLKTALESKTMQFSNLETDHLHLQQLWISMQHHDHPGASPATFQHNMQSAFHPKDQEQLEELQQAHAKEKEEQKRDQEREDKRKKEEQMWKETLDDANMALEEMQQSMLHSSQQLTTKTQEHQQLLKEFNRLETSA
jgi:flagellar biosynthesis GTPase FlhF